MSAQAPSPIATLLDAAPDLRALEDGIVDEGNSNVVRMPGKRTLRGYLSEIDFIADTVEALDDSGISEQARGELGKRLVEAIAGTREKIDNSTQVLATFEHLEEAALAEMARLKKRAEYFARQKARLEEYLLNVLAQRNLPRLDGNTSAIELKLCPPSVVIDCADAIPEEFMRFPAVPDPAPDKAAIKKALAAGGAVPGCHIERAKRLSRS